MAGHRRDEEQDRSSGMENLAEKSARTPGSASNLATYMKGIDMPCSKNDLLRHAEQNGAPDEVRRYLANMPDRQYRSMADVMVEFGKEK